MANDRKGRLLELVGELEQLNPDQVKSLHDFLAEHHEAFCLEEHKRAETDLIQLEINTEDACPKSNQPDECHLQYVKRWRGNRSGSPVWQPLGESRGMVRKKDSSHRFYVDYRQQNSVTKADTFPFPRIEDLLVGSVRQVEVLNYPRLGCWLLADQSTSPLTGEDSAFITLSPQGLYKFRVMPFGLANAPVVFQRLMQRVLLELNPEEGLTLLRVYIDDVLSFSHTLEEHLHHLQLVIKCPRECGLKLKLTKCHFIWKEVEYLAIGHMITPEGLKINPRLVSAMQEFPPPCNIREVHQFLGLSSYCRSFILLFSKMAQL